MGFHKRRITENWLRDCYRTGGTNEVMKLFNVDCVIMGDKFSSEVSNIVMDATRDPKSMNETLSKKFEEC